MKRAFSGEEAPGLERARLYWDERAKNFAENCEAVEQSKRTQRMRFEVFVSFHDLRGKSVLDVGCGVGDLCGHLQERGIDCEYTGFDVSPEMIRRCRERFPGGLVLKAAIFSNGRPASRSTTQLPSESTT